MFSFIACIILLCKAFGGVIFEVQTYINSKREVEVSPRGTRIFSKWFAGILGIFFIYILAGYYMPVILYTPRILSGVSIGIQGEVLSNHQEEIAFIWIAVACFLFVLTGRRLLLALTQRVQIKRKRTEILFMGKRILDFTFGTGISNICVSVCISGFSYRRLYGGG
mgnify:CR=1 FL=1